MGMNANSLSLDPSPGRFAPKQHSGLKEAMRILKGVHEIGFVHLTEEDVVRHPCSEKIILAYNAEEKKKREE